MGHPSLSQTLQELRQCYAQLTAYYFACSPQGSGHDGTVGWRGLALTAYQDAEQVHTWLKTNITIDRLGLCLPTALRCHADTEHMRKTASRANAALRSRPVGPLRRARVALGLERQLVRLLGGCLAQTHPRAKELTFLTGNARRRTGHLLTALYARDRLQRRANCSRYLASCSAPPPSLTISPTQSWSDRIMVEAPGCGLEGWAAAIPNEAQRAGMRLALLSPEAQNYSDYSSMEARIGELAAAQMVVVVLHRPEAPSWRPWSELDLMSGATHSLPLSETHLGQLRDRILLGHDLAAGAVTSRSYPLVELARRSRELWRTRRWVDGLDLLTLSDQDPIPYELVRMRFRLALGLGGAWPAAQFALARFYPQQAATCPEFTLWTAAAGSGALSGPWSPCAETLAADLFRDLIACGRFDAARTLVRQLTLSAAQGQLRTLDREMIALNQTIVAPATSDSFRDLLTGEKLRAPTARYQPEVILCCDL